MAKAKHDILVFNSCPIESVIAFEELLPEISFTTASSIDEVSHLCQALEKPPTAILFNSGTSINETLSSLESLKSLFPDVSEILLFTPQEYTSNRADFMKAGFCEIIFTPTDPEYIVLKIQKICARVEKIKKLEKKSKNAAAAAMSAIQDTADQASVIHFFQETINCNGMQDLTDLIVKTAKVFELECTVQVRTPWHNFLGYSIEAPEELQLQMFDSLKDMGRIYQIGQKLILNFEEITQIITNMPIEDEEKCGRLRDNLALILDNAIVRMKSLHMVEELKKILAETNAAINKFQDSQKSIQNTNVKIIDSMIEEMQSNVSAYGLSEQQENSLLHLVENYSDKFFETYDGVMQADQEMSYIVSKLDGSINRFVPGQHSNEA